MDSRYVFVDFALIGKRGIADVTIEQRMGHLAMESKGILAGENHIASGAAE